jgi:hypothetical protein
VTAESPRTDSAALRSTPVAIVDSFPESRVHNSQPEGIGRVATVRHHWAWNNLGRNIVFASSAFHPRAVFDQTQFPDDDEPSQYDLDVHAVLEISPTAVVALNHLGLLRAFRVADLESSGAVTSLEPIWVTQFADDVERVVAVGDRLIGSRPRHEQAGGLLVSQPLGDTPGPDVVTTAALEQWGVVTALAAVTTPSGPPAVAVGDDGRLALFTINDGVVEHPTWEAGVDFRPAMCRAEGGLLWAAGSERSSDVDDYDWEALVGGGFVGLDPEDGAVVVEGRFGSDVAWGNGGCAVVMTDPCVCAIGRTGSVHLFSRRDGRLVASTPATADQSLGIAHAAAAGNQILFGFNRAGYQLNALDVSLVSDEAAAT